MRLASDGRQRCNGERQVLDGVERSLRGRWDRDLTAFRTVADVAIYFQQITPSQLPAIVVSRDEMGNKKTTVEFDGGFCVGIGGRKELLLLGNDLGELALLEGVLAEDGFDLSVAFHLLSLTLAIVAAESDLYLANFDRGVCVQLATGERAGFLLVLLGSNQLVVGLGRKLLGAFTELLHATGAAEIDLAFLVVNGLVSLDGLVWHHHAHDAFQWVFVFEGNGGADKSTDSQHRQCDRPTLHLYGSSRNPKPGKTTRFMRCVRVD